MSEVNFNEKSKITEGGVTLNIPKQAKGGVFAPADIKLIKAALSFYIQHADDTMTEADERHVANLLHRLNNRI